MSRQKKHLVILGTHGIPARHGGFETCAEKLALHMREYGWNVTVYGQADQSGIALWHGIACVSIKRLTGGVLGYLNPVLHDLMAIWHARTIDAVFVTLGYNTALFNLILTLYRRRQIINMDGMEWQRSKYQRWHEKAWLRLNQWIALRIAHVCIADHTAIADYLQSRYNKTPIATIAYGADSITADQTDPNVLPRYNLEPQRYGLIIARPEPENQILEMVTAWRQSSVDWPLIVLGTYKDHYPYHQAVLQAAGNNVHFIGAVYDPMIVRTLRFYAGVYLHGHSVGGTNPSLVEAMAAGRPIIAHDNVYNRGVVADGADYFQDIPGLVQCLHNRSQAEQKALTAHKRYEQSYQWSGILQAYGDLIDRQWQMRHG